MPIDPTRVRRCKSYTIGLTDGRFYTVRRVVGDMIEIQDDHGVVGLYWNWRFDPGPPVPPALPWRMGA